MESLTHLETRVHALEASLRRSRLVAVGLGVGLAFSVVGMTVDSPTAAEASPTPQVAPDRAAWSEASTAEALLASQAQEQLATERLLLVDAGGGGGIVLRAGPDASLIVESSDGREILRIGGTPARHAR